MDGRWRIGDAMYGLLSVDFFYSLGCSAFGPSALIALGFLALATRRRQA